MAEPTTPVVVDQEFEAERQDTPGTSNKDLSDLIAEIHSLKDRFSLFENGAERNGYRRSIPFRLPPNPNDDDDDGEFEFRRSQLRADYEYEVKSLEKEWRFYQQKNAKEKEDPRKVTQPSHQSEDSTTTGSAARGGETLAREPKSSPRYCQLSWDQFRTAANVAPEEAWTIDVLEGEPDLEESDFYTTWQKRQPATLPERKILPGRSLFPERIRIHSKQILKVFLGASDAPAGLDALSPAVFIRPFRALVHHESDLRLRTKRLKQKLQGLEEYPVPLANVPVTAGSVDSVKDDASKENEDLEFLSKTTLQELECLLAFMDTEISPKLRCLRGSACEEVWFADLWCLFQPGDMVFSPSGKQAYRVIRIDYPPHNVEPPWTRWYRSAEEKIEKVDILCVYIDFDGKRLGPVTRMFSIQKYDGKRAITLLPIYPLQFGKDSEMLERLIQRGKEFIRVVDMNAMHYIGLTLDTKDEVDSQVVIDFEGAFTLSEQQEDWMPKVEQLVSLLSEPSSAARREETCRAQCCMNDRIYDDLYVDKERSERFVRGLVSPPDGRSELPSVAACPRTLQDCMGLEILTNDELLILPSRVFGFVLRSRKWAMLDLEYLQPITIANEGNKSSFDQIVLPPGHKDILLSLITQYFRDRESAMSRNAQLDFVRGKGKGLIFLLHGAPGVGKTMTAECVAELFSKPLFQITCGELGTTAGEMETALQRIFTLANRWGCILLLDEADVFFARRTDMDFIRNGLVAVFLRVLEYYPGILFLTTNRVGVFDEAFASRIHSLFYPPLDEAATKSIFNLNLDRVQGRFNDGRLKLRIDHPGVISFAIEYWRKNPTARWNGRQIRNACQAALALAEYGSQLEPEVKLEVRHFERVVDGYLQFAKYVDEIFGTDAETRAKEAFSRAPSRSGHAGQEEPPNPLLAPPEQNLPRASSTPQELFSLGYPQQGAHGMALHPPPAVRYPSGVFPGTSYFMPSGPGYYQRPMQGGAFPIPDNL